MLHYMTTREDTCVTSNYAISYKVYWFTGKSKDCFRKGQTLETEQLYYDQKMNGFLLKKFKFTDIKGSTNGQGIDFSKDFKIVNSHKD
jgi:hypothetical protein